MSDPKQPLHVKRKLLQEVQVRKGVMLDKDTIVLPCIKLIMETYGRKGMKLS